MTPNGNSPNAEQAVESPTYLADIRFYFRPQDIEHMAAKGIDLGTYDGVKDNAISIDAHTSPPDADMPPDEEARWSAARVQTFEKWIADGFPLGTAKPVEPPPPPQAPARLRKEVTTLSDAEFELLAKAFNALMARDPDDPNGYFVLAGHHWLPKRFCLHHEDRFNPWHRQYLLEFEDALRSVPGCEDVTIPYWDFSTPLPERLQHPPFDKYVLPADPGAAAVPPKTGFFPYTTQRYPVAEITQNMADSGVLADTATSLNQSLWGAYNKGGYQKFSIQAHDSGHLSIGPTMADQNVASYDPVFWFFHCNLDRLWLSWQTHVGATTLTTFLSTLAPTQNKKWLTQSPFNALKPFSVTADQTIESKVSYDRLEPVAPPEDVLENLFGSIAATSRFAFRSASPVSVRVKGIDRLNIPGSFVVSLLADGEPIAKRGFFQPDDPRLCATCVEHGIVNLDFRMTQDQLVDKTLSVRIDVPSHAEEIGTAFPLSQAGDPTVNARLLVEEA
ncbi:tyrosinase family protein [Kitasatospora sp. NPDC093806]|uniref:tyrosinase family protein n=1 Tax=Kitasatospora sp. NPDC093806 TaxID=3155075 RepID=UPI0034236514